MKDGKLVEYGSADQVLAHSQHIHTQPVLRAVPRLAHRA
jgi:ABC-type oligopeptide transport system ATPase subunit